LEENEISKDKNAPIDVEEKRDLLKSEEKGEIGLGKEEDEYLETEVEEPKSRYGDS